MLPSVSVVMPVGYGDKYFAVALNCFLNQTYDLLYDGQLEIVVVDNSDKPIRHLLPDDERIKYHRRERMSVGALRNVGTKLATGEICFSGDEDDWSSADRIAEQVDRLVGSGKSVTGFHNLLYWDTAIEKAHKYFYEVSGRNHPPYAMGTSQCYLKSWWAKYPFPEGQRAEDFGFQQEALHRSQLDSTDCGQLCVARAHRDSQCPPQFGHKQFPAVSNNDLPKEFFDAIGVEK
jgi:glycosyltransferase involved in cell wall biosynthesis